MTAEDRVVPRHATEHTLQHLQDPLSEATRSARTSLLVASTTGIVIVWADLVPTRIAALGIELGQVDQRSLLIMLAAIIAYFLVTFLMYGGADWTAWRISRRKALVDHERKLASDRIPVPENTVQTTIPTEALRESNELLEAVEDYYDSAFRGERISDLRAVLEFGVPVMVALTSLILVVVRIL